MQGPDFICRGYGDSLAAVQLLATQSRYCPEAITLQEGEQDLTEPEQRQEEEESPYRSDGEGEPNEILRHTLTKFSGARA